MAVTVDTFKDFFDRGQFDYGTDTTEIRDKDITQALAEANAVFNVDLYPTDDDGVISDMALHYLTAHFLTGDVDACDSGGQSVMPQNSRSADGVSESVTIPEWMTSGDFAMYITTYYGQKFLMLSKPYLDGAVYIVDGSTQA